MCGINGFTFSNRSLIQRMNRLVSHRGPDDSGEYVNNQVSLGNTRLSIIDLSPKGHMPMGTRDHRFWITFNGEIYNYPKLRSHLIRQGCKFKSNTDTEVVLQGFALCGHQFIPKLQGMFALAIWDNQTQTLTLARDRAGIKPLYYSLFNRQLIFSSEIKAMLIHRLDTSLDHHALNLYFRLYYIPSPSTIYKHIQKLSPAEILTFQNGTIKVKKYYHPPPVNKKLTATQAIPLIKSAISRSVKSHLTSERPVGVFLSGGLDSSLVLHFAAKHHSQPLNTYTVGFKVDQEWDKYNQDLTNARFTSNYYNTNHHEIIVSAQDLISNFDRIIYHLDEPINNSTQIANFQLAQYASPHIKVALTGDGGDELFAGYPRYQHLYYLRIYQQIPLLIRRLTPQLVSLYSQRLKALAIKANLADSSAIQTLLMSEPDTTMAQLLSPSINQPRVATDFFRTILVHRLTQDINNFTLTDFMTWLPEESLIKSDKLTMAHGLEQRQPFLDTKLVNLSATIPLWQKIDPFTTKKLIRRLATGLLPDQITSAPKWGFFSPISKWLRSDLKDYVYDTLNTRSLDQYIDLKFTKQLMDQHCAGAYHPHLIWSVVTFIRWHHQFIKQKAK